MTRWRSACSSADPPPAALSGALPQAGPAATGTISAGAGPVGVCSGKWQAARWPSPKGRNGGSSAAQTSWAKGQRVRKRQPEGGSSGDGSSPRMCSFRRSLWVGSATGMVPINACV